MNSLQRVLNRLAGQPVDRAPNFNLYMAFAARYCQFPLRKYYLDYRALADANQAMVDQFGADLYQAISDSYREAADLGAEIDFPEDNLPVSRVPLIKTAADAQKLRPLAPEHGRRMSDRLEAVRLMAERGGQAVPVMGWVEGALAEAGDLCGPSHFLLALMDEPPWLMDVLEVCCQVAIQFACAQIRAGAFMVGLGDALASQISPKMYERFALPYEQRIFEAIHRAGGFGRLHICGKTTHLLPAMVRSGADVIDLDWMVDFGQASAAYGGQVSFCGNANPVAVMLQGTPDQVAQITQHCLRVGGPRSFSGAGCEIPEGTPQENLRSQMRALQEFTPSRDTAC
jgi:MtaA/CmuA family methyltransferase